MSSSDWATAIVVLLFLAMTAINVIGFAAARRRRPGPNTVFGIRTAQTLRSRETWEASQVVGWRSRLPLVPVYLAAVVVLVVHRALGGSDRLLLPVVIVVAVTDLVLSLLAVSRANRAAREARAA